MMRMTVVVAMVLISAGLWAAEPTTQRALPYNDKADATRDIDEATQRAKQKNQRVLLDVGANWCGWCLRLHELFTGNQKVGAILKESYQVVYVDAGHGEKNRDILVFYGLDVRNYPHLAVLDTEGNVIIQQDTGIFESNGTHVPEKVAAFLEKWKTPTAK